MVVKGKTFCRKCGKTDEKLIKGLCPSCFIQETQLISIPDRIKVTICTHCGSTQKKSKWYDSKLSLDEMVLQAIQDQLKTSEPSFDLNPFPEILNVRGSHYHCLVGIEARVLDKKVYQEYPVSVNINRTVCPHCSKFASGYYEAVIQIRADKRTPSPEELENAHNIIKKGISRLVKKNRMAYISEMVEIKEGVDYYVGSYKAARKLTEDLRNVLGGVVQESPRLMGRDKSSGKDLYRIWISLRMPRFQVGDFVSYGNLKAQVLSIKGQKIVLKDLKSPHTSTVSWKDYAKIQILAYKDEVKMAMVTAKTPHSIQILRPDTYEPVDLEGNEIVADTRIGDEVPVVEIKGVLYPLKNESGPDKPQI